MWYINLPEFIEGGFGTKNNLLMVDGSDKMLDILSDNKDEVTLTFSNGPIQNWDKMKSQAETKIMHQGMNKEILDAVGHAPIDHGRYHKVNYEAWKGENHKNFGRSVAWLCPVAEWVFGEYPHYISVQTV